MELAALPRHRRKDGGLSGAQDGVVVADDELDAVQFALLQALEEVTRTVLHPLWGGFDSALGGFARSILGVACFANQCLMSRVWAMCPLLQSWIVTV